MMSAVRSAIKCSMACWINCSGLGGYLLLEVASSSIRTRGIKSHARAKEINCFCPTDKPAAPR